MAEADQPPRALAYEVTGTTHRSGRVLRGLASVSVNVDGSAGADGMVDDIDNILAEAADEGILGEAQALSEAEQLRLGEE